ncbi:MAG: HD-GYP domain-containing protein [Deferrisomatales bacterium]|nr:HD-GYP domain-containing protein [Deferrisomatales bacterium]
MIKKIRVEDLQVGMFVSDFNVPWMDHPFMGSQKRIKSAKEVAQIIEHGIREVFIDTAKGQDSGKAVSERAASTAVRSEMEQQVAPPGGESPPSPAVIDEQNREFEEELQRAKVVYSEAKVMVKDLLVDARLGKSVDGERAAQVVDKMVDSIFRNPDALSSLSRLKNFDDYTFQHSLNVSVLALTLGRHLGLVQDELKRLGVGAILHDIGKMRVPEAILNKPGKYTDDEFEIMKRHPLHGAKILMDNKNVPNDCANVALNHHERFNGKGYPRGLSGMGIGKFGLISAIVDVYDAISSDRVYHKGMPSHVAMQKIFEWGKNDFYPIYVQKFVQCVGIYPIGTPVRLDTGELGVVYRQHHNVLVRPWVRLVTDAAGVPLARHRDVDLREADPRGAKEYARTIGAVLDPQSAGFDVEGVLLPGESQRAA